MMTTPESNEWHNWRGQITESHKSLRESVENKIDTVHDKLDTVNGAILEHIEDDRISFDKIHKELSNGDKQFTDLRNSITKVVAIGGVALVILGWIANALIQKYVQ